MEALLEAIEGRPGRSAGEIANHLGLDKSNCRRDLKKLCRDGKAYGRDDGGTYRFWPAGALSYQEPVRLARPKLTTIREPVEQIVDVPFRVVENVTDSRLARPPAATAGTAMIIHRMPQTPVSGARAVVPRHTIEDMGNHLAALFDADPELVNAAFARQQVAPVVDENQRLRAALVAKDRQHAAELEEVEQRARDDQMHDAMQAVLNWRSGAPRRDCYDMNRSYPASNDYEEEATHQTDLRGEKGADPGAARRQHRGKDRAPISGKRGNEKEEVPAGTGLGASLCQ